MAFIDIKEPKERDILDSTTKRRWKSIRSKEASWSRNDIQSNDLSHREVYKGDNQCIGTLRDEIKTVGNLLPAIVSRKQIWDKNSQLNAIDYYLNKYAKKVFI